MTRADRFSRRMGYKAVEPEISIREDAPEMLRAEVLAIGTNAGVRTSSFRDIVCRACGVLPDRNNWSEGNVWMETEGLVAAAEWPVVYDLIEDLYDYIRSHYSAKLEGFQADINRHFRETGIGWQLVDGQIQTRGPGAFESAVRGSAAALAEGSRPTASQELHQAFLDLSRRPDPDRTGAVQHALAALECIARDACGDPRATLGAILQRHPELFPKPLDVAAEKVWAFASEMGRHLREGREPTRLDTELVVGLSAVLAAHLERKLNVRERAAGRAVVDPCTKCGEQRVVMEEGCRRCLACGFNEC